MYRPTPIYRSSVSCANLFSSLGWNIKRQIMVNNIYLNLSSVCLQRQCSENVSSDRRFLWICWTKTHRSRTISSSLLVNLRNWCIGLTTVRGQGFDGCSTMPGEVSGVETRITEELSDAKYFVHCRSHCLNIMIFRYLSNYPGYSKFHGDFGESYRYVVYQWFQ
jgi:hypothetical protein